LNDCANPPSRAAEAAKNAGAVPLLMRPGDAMELDANGLEAAAAACSARGKDLDAAFEAARRGEKPKRTSANVPLSDLVTAVHAGLERLRAGVSKIDANIMRLQLPRAAFALRDQPFVVVIDRLEKVSLEPQGAKADVLLSSEALKFAFSNDFGFDTLLVNGRFEEARPGGSVAVMKLCGQFGYVRRKTSLLREIVRRRIFGATRMAVERFRNRALA
jgi:hypothetical protein